MVVTGAGSASGPKSQVNSPVPHAIGAVLSPRRWTDQQPGTGSQKYSSSVNPSSRGRNRSCQWVSIWSSTSAVQWMVAIEGG
jgi:hypothetical protein